MHTAQIGAAVTGTETLTGTMPHFEAEPQNFGPQNPFYAPSPLPYGAPPFDRIHDADYEPALLAGMVEQRREIEAIAVQPAAPTFANTVEALEQTGALLDRVEAVFGALAGAYTNPVIERVQQQMAAKMAAHADAIFLDARLFARLKTLYDTRHRLPLHAEALRLLEFYYTRFVHAGAKLNDAGKLRLKAWNEEESTLSNAFQRKLLAANKAGAYVTQDASALAGMSPAQMHAAAALAKERGLDGYVVPLQNTTQQPALAQISVRSTRQALFENSWTRAERIPENDTRATIARLAQVRAEKARLLGYPSYAAWKLEDQMAQTPGTAIQFMDEKVATARAQVEREEIEIQKAIDAHADRAAEASFKVKPWDWEFYAEQVRRARYDLDEAGVRPYFELDRVLRDGVFYAANRLFGLAFEERRDLPVYAPDVRVYEVFNPDGSHLALFYTDWWKRDNKRGGAWMGSFLRQSRLLNAEPIIYNVANFPKPAEGEPALITFDEVITIFHEFGHALHGMFASVDYPSLSGTSVPRDFVEFPSQFNERWAIQPEVFEHYALHCETREPMPKDLAARLKTAANFNRGYESTEVLAAAQLDMQWHTLAPETPIQDLEEFENTALLKKGLHLDAVPPRYRSSYFSHIWGGGYAAGYYAYLWSERLDDRAFQWFEDHGGMTRANGDRLRAMILSRGNTEDLTAMYDRCFADPQTGGIPLS